MDVRKNTSKRRWPGRRVAVLGGLALVLASSGFALVGLGSARPKVVRAELWIDVARSGEMLNEIRATGTLIPKEVRWISAETAGTVQEVLALPGERVEVDTVILRLSNPSVRAKYEAARAAHAGVEADVGVQGADLELQLVEQGAALARAESTYRLSKARTEAQARAEAAGAVSRMDLRQSEIALEQDHDSVRVESERMAAQRRNFDARMRAIRAKFEESLSALTLARRELEALEVRAGIDGILQQMDAEPGRQVTLGASLALVAKQDVLIARLLVPELQAKDLGLGLRAQVDLRASVAEGRIERIDPAVKDGRVAVDVGFAQPLPAAARPDLSVDGRIVVARLPNAISVGRPAAAIPNGRGSLFVLRDDALAERVPVIYGVASSDRVQVREGIRPGDRVILSDVSRWSKYDALQIE